MRNSRAGALGAARRATQNYAGPQVGNLVLVGVKLPVNMLVGAYFNVLRPQFGSPWQLRTQLTLVFWPAAPTVRRDRYSCRSRGQAEGNIVVDHGRRSDRDLPGFRQAELLKFDLVVPDLSEELGEHLDRERRAVGEAVAAMPKEANRRGLSLATACRPRPENGRPLLTILARRPSATSKLVRSNGHRARQARGTCSRRSRRWWHTAVAFGIEGERVVPLCRVTVGRGVWGSDVAMPLVRQSKRLRTATDHRSTLVCRTFREPGSPRRAENLHDVQFERGVRRIVCVVVISGHRLGEPGAHVRVAAIRGQSCHDRVHRRPPLAQRHEVVEALEHNVLLAEMLAVAGVLEPVVNKGPFWIGDPSGSDVIHARIDPPPEQIYFSIDRRLLEQHGSARLQGRARRRRDARGLPRWNIYPYGELNVPIDIKEVV